MCPRVSTRRTPSSPTTTDGVGASLDSTMGAGPGSSTSRMVGGTSDSPGVGSGRPDTAERVGDAWPWLPRWRPTNPTITRKPTNATNQPTDPTSARARRTSNRGAAVGGATVHRPSTRSGPDHRTRGSGKRRDRSQPGCWVAELRHCAAYRAGLSKHRSAQDDRRLIVRAIRRRLPAWLMHVVDNEHRTDQSSLRRPGVHVAPRRRLSGIHLVPSTS